MAKIEWNNGFSVGNDTIDRQHRKLVELYNTFARVMKESDPLGTRGPKVEALQIMHEYAVYHFRYEEHYMANLDYPGLLHHWRMHKDFDYKIFAYLRRLETGRLVSSDEVLGMLRQWLTEHILQEDMGVRKFLESRAEAEHAV